MTADLSSLIDDAVNEFELAMNPPQNYGETMLDEVRRFIERFVTFPSPAVLDMVTLWIAHTHVVDGCERLAFDTTPRLAFISDEPASGKTRALELVCELAHKGKMLIDVTHPSFAEEVHQNQATIGIDEMDVLFGAGGAKRVLRSLLNAGYKRKGATWTRARQDEMCIFGPVALAGLGKTYRAADALKALRTRTIPVIMKPAAGKAETYRPRQHDAMAEALRKRLGKWAVRHAPLILEDWPEMPEGVEDRLAELWEPLFMVANAAGGHWPESAVEACKELALGSQENLPEELPLSMQLLADLRTVFGDADALGTAQIVQRLYDLPESQWRRLWPNEAAAPRELSELLGEGVAPVKMRDGDRTFRGYARSTLEPLWSAVPDVPDVPDVPEELFEEV